MNHDKHTNAPKKPYTAPKMTVIKTSPAALLCDSGDNAYWGGCWQESENGYWEGK